MADETIICDDRDPLWIDKEIKKIMIEKNLALNRTVVRTKTCSF